ncbi:unnamed protein product, partial [marine sediment metagenome]
MLGGIRLPLNDVTRQKRLDWVDKNGVIGDLNAIDRIREDFTAKSVKCR